MMIEKLYRIKRNIRNFLYRRFSIDCPYTCILPNRVFLKKLYRKRTGKKLHLSHPKLLAEKLQWLKLYYRDARQTVMVDKYLSRDYVKEITGVDYAVPLLGVWDKADDIDFDSLPDKFVLKCNHDNGIFVCKDKSLIDFEEVKKEFNERLERDFYRKCREWPYKNVKRKIICESYIENSDGSDLVDYKFYCYGGKVRYFMCSVGEAVHDVRNHKFDTECNSIDHLFKKKPSLPKEEIRLPENIDKMLELANVLCEGFPHLRVDMYNVDGRVYVGELTFFSNAGFINILDEEYSNSLADLIDIKKIRKEHKREKRV